MGKGKVLKFTERWGGCQGSEVACDLNLIARSAMWEPTVPPICEKFLQDCLICLETIGEPSKDILLKCDCCKNYHNSCLQRWIDERNSCPICKMVVNNKNQTQSLVVYQYQNENFERQQFLSLYNYSLRYIFAIIYFYFITITMCYLIFWFYYNMVMLLIYGWSMG